MRIIITCTYKSGAKTKDDRVFADLEAFETYCTDTMGIRAATGVDIEESWLHLYAGGKLDQPFDPDIECSWTMHNVCIDCGANDVPLYSPRLYDNTPGQRCEPCRDGELVVQRYFDPTESWIIWTNDDDADFGDDTNADMRLRMIMDPVQRMEGHEAPEQPGFTFTYWLFFEGKTEAGEWELIDDQRNVTVSDSSLIMECYPDMWDLTTDQTYAVYKAKRDGTYVEPEAETEATRTGNIRVNATIDTDAGKVDIAFTIHNPGELVTIMHHPTFGYGMTSETADSIWDSLARHGSAHYCNMHLTAVVGFGR